MKEAVKQLPSDSPVRKLILLKPDDLPPSKGLAECERFWEIGSFKTKREILRAKSVMKEELRKIKVEVRDLLGRCLRERSIRWIPVKSKGTQFSLTTVKDAHAAGKKTQTHYGKTLWA